MKSKIVGLTLIFIFFLSSCSPETTPTALATLVPTATTAPTFTPTPVTYLPGLSMKVPEPETAFIQQVVNENYLSVMGLTREQVVLSYKEHTGIDSQPYVVMVDDSTGVPLAIYTKVEWQKSTLKFFGKQLGIAMGTDSLGPNDVLVPGTVTVLDDFSKVVLGTDWNADEPTQGNIDPNNVDFSKYMIEYAKRIGITDFTLHAVLYSLPTWLQEGNFSQQELREIMRSRIEFALKTNPDATFIVVVNEPYQEDNPGRQNDPFYKAWGGYNYILEAFQIARDTADAMGRKDIKLIFNDSDNHYRVGSTSYISRLVVPMLKKENLIDYLGMQMHIGEWTDGAFDNLMVPQMPLEIAFYKQMGVPVVITELTYAPSEKEMALSPREFNQRLSHVFSEIFRIAIESDNVKGITTWGYTDAYLKSVNWYQLFDEYGQKKQSYYEVLKVLYEHIP